MSIITKQLIINDIRLPMVLIDIIKDYCFYNIEEMTKKYKYKLHRAIMSAESTRANKFNNHPEYSDNDPHWSFGFIDENVFNETIQLQGLMCISCGDYQKPRYHIITCYRDYRVECKCEDFLEEEPDYDSDDFGDDDFDP